MKTLLTIYLLVFCGLYVFGSAAAEDKPENTPKNTKEKSWKDKYISANLLIGKNNHQVELAQKSGTRVRTYVPIDNQEFGAAVTYDRYTLSYTFKDRDSSDLPYYRGKTSYFNIFLSYNFKNQSGEVYYQKYKGLYLEDEASAKNEFDAYGSGASRLSTKNYGLQYYYAFEKEFLLSKLTSYPEKAYKSGGSWIAHGYLNRFILTGNPRVISDSDTAYFLDIADLHQLNGYGIGAGGGYGHYFGSQNLYFSFLFSLGFGYQHQELFYTSHNSRQNALGSNVALKLGAGGFWRKYYYAGVTMDIISNSYEIKDDNVDSQTLANFLYFGRSF